MLAPHMFDTLKLLSAGRGLFSRGPPTTHHPHKRTSSSGGILGDGVRIVGTKEEGKNAPPPVLHSRWVVRGFRVLNLLFVFHTGNHENHENHETKI